MLSLKQNLSNQLKLTPQQIQYQKLLQLNTVSLEQRIKLELELNPILDETLTDEIDVEEIQDEDEFDDIEPEISDNDIKDDNDDVYEADNLSDSEFSIEDFMNDAGVDDTVKYNNNDEDDDKGGFSAVKAITSLNEHLLNQLNLLDIDDKLYILGELIIGNLDESGYLKRDIHSLVDELHEFEHVEINEQEALELLKTIQTFDPVGIATSNMQECLLIQLKHSSFDPYYSSICETVLRTYYDEFFNKKFDILQTKLKINKDTLQSVLDLIKRLNPKPGEGTIASAEINHIIPDFLIEKIDNSYIITLNDRSSISITINQTYLDMLNGNKRKRKISDRDKEIHSFLKEKYDSAKWFIDALKQRRATLMKIMYSIFERQKEYFDFGPNVLKPLLYKDIAEMTSLDISTISRSVRGKYVQSPQGINELKYFFNEGLMTESGESMAVKQIREKLKEIINNEPAGKPYSDDKLTDLLKDTGIHIARRTVTKYREGLGIAVARLRKNI